MSKIKSVIALCAPFLLLSGCSMFDSIGDMFPDNRENYKASEETQPLELPPGFESNRIRDQMTVPQAGQGGVATLSEYTHQTPTLSSSSAAVAAPTPAVLPLARDFELKRAGDQQWLVVKEPVAKVWEALKQFWRENGIAVINSDANTGVMETEWLDNPSHSGRDRYRVRLERGDTAEQTRVFLTHRGVTRLMTATAPSIDPETAQAEIMGGEVSHEQALPRAAWQARPSDPELEAEMLQRFIVFAGIVQPRSEAVLLAENQTRTSEGVPAARLERKAGQLNLLASYPLEETWRRAGIALDRIGFTVIERDHPTKTYVVRYVDPDVKKPEDEEEDKSFWGNLFSSDSEDFVQTYQVALAQIGRDLTRVQVLNEQGADVRTKAAEQILSLLQEQL